MLELIVLFSISTSMWQRLGVGSLSESTAVSTSASTCTSDSESVVVVSNLFLSGLGSDVVCLVTCRLQCRDC